MYEYPLYYVNYYIAIQLLHLKPSSVAQIYFTFHFNKCYDFIEWIDEYFTSSFYFISLSLYFICNNSTEEVECK